MEESSELKHFAVTVGGDRYEVYVAPQPEAWRLKVRDYNMTCGACPAQWDITLDDGRYLYVRYRWGGLSVSFDVDGERLLQASKVGDAWDGSMSLETLQRLTESILNWDNAVSMR